MHQQKIDDILTKPFSLWLIAVIIAVGLWTYVIGAEATGEINRTISCKVEYINVAPQLEIKNRINEIWVYASGRENDMDILLNDNNITCEADARGLTAGRYRIPVKVTLPKGIRLREIRPSQVEINLVRYADRLVDVELVLPRDLQEGLYLDSVEIVPRQVAIKGIENDLARIGKIKISPTMEELRSGKELLLPPEIESSESFEDEVKVEPKQVRLKAILVSGNPRRIFPVRARISGKPDEDYVMLSTMIDPAEVLVEGPTASLDGLTFIETSTIDITGIKESTSMAVPVRPPQNRSLTVLGEGTVKVSVALRPVSATKEIVNIPVTIKSDGQTNWKVIPPVVTVTIEGLPSSINSPATESLDIGAYVDAQNIFSRQAVLPVRTSIDSQLFKIIKVNPFTISIAREPE